MTDKFKPGQKVSVRHVDALGRSHLFENCEIMRFESQTNLWRVDIGGLGIAFSEEDIHAVEERNAEVQAGAAPLGQQEGSSSNEPAAS